MTCVGPCCALDRAFDERMAARQLRRYRRRGAAGSTRRLLRRIHEAGVAGGSVLDVGGGIGAIALELLESGAAGATIVDASGAFVAAAGAEARRRRVQGRLTLVHADFVDEAARIPPADVVTLDRVVCCYPDMDRLLTDSAARALRLYGIVYPRDGWWTRLGIATTNAFFRLRRMAFRVYAHPSTAIEATIRRAGLSLRSRERGVVWVVDLYERRAPAS